MRGEKIKKIKDLLENAIKKARFGLEREGTDTTTEEYQERIENLKATILKKVGVTKEEYELAERFFDTELDLLRTKIRVGKLETKKTKWGEVEEKPEIKAFDQSQIKDLEFSQLKHRDEDHATIVGSITDLKEEDRALAEKIQKTKEELQKQMTTPKIRHGELLAVGKDDHHPEEHNLESHVESDWKDKFKRLIGGQRVDDLHTHAFPLDKPWVGEPWGITKGDTDVWYLHLAGTNSPSANINWGGFKITNLADPTADQDASTKAYVDAQITGENWWDRAGTVLSPHNAGDSVTGVNITSGVDPGHTHSIYLIDAPSDGTMYGRRDGAWERMTLMPPVEEYWDITEGLPPLPEEGDRYISDGEDEELGWYDGYIYEWDGEEWVESIPEIGWMVWLMLEMVLWVFMSGGWREVGWDSYWSIENDQTSLTGDKTGSFDLTTTGTITGINVTSGTDPGHTHTAYQPIDADLSAIAALGFVSTSFLKKTAADTWALDTNTYLTAVTAHNLLSAIHGDTVVGSALLGDLIYADATPNWTKLAGNITTTKKYLSQTGTSAISAIPAWAQIAIGDLASFTSASLAGVVSDETGSGALVFANTPTLVTPVLGAATATSINAVIIGLGGGSIAGNIAIGIDALKSNTTGSLNIALGREALYSNTTGFGNTAFGYDSIHTNIDGTANTAFGYSSLYSNIDGGANTVFGYQALYSNTAGDSNVALGTYAGYYETGSNKLFIDNQARASEADARVKSLIYGVFDALTANQYVNINGAFNTLGAINKVTITAPTTSAILTLITGSSLVTAGAYSLTLTTTATTVATFPAGTTTLASLTGVETFTGKVSYNGLVITADTGAITTGSWHGTTIAEDHGGTGVANLAGHTITIAGPFSTVGHFTLSLTATANTAVTLPTTGTLSTLAGVETFTNKRITQRVTTVADSATPTPAGDDSDMFTVTALAQAATFGAPTGTPTSGQKLIIRVLDNGTARALAWNAIYRAGTDVALPTTTVLSKTLYCGFIYNVAATKWDLVAVTNNI